MSSWRLAQQAAPAAADHLRREVGICAAVRAGALSGDPHLRARHSAYLAALAASSVVRSFAAGHGAAARSVPVARAPHADEVAHQRAPRAGAASVCAAAPEGATLGHFRRSPALDARAAARCAHCVACRKSSRSWLVATHKDSNAESRLGASPHGSAGCAHGGWRIAVEVRK